MKRRVAGTDGDGSSAGNGARGVSFVHLKRLDIYSRPKSEFQRATPHGAAATVILVGAVLALAWRELVFSMKTEIVEKLFVNSTISSTVNVTFDVVFGRIPCTLLSLDAEDALGIPQENLRHDVTRTRLDLAGRPLDGSEKHGMGNTLKEAIANEAEKHSAQAEARAGESRENSGGGDGKSEDVCSCYGAGSEGECCRTCNDIRAAYRRKGWRIDIASVPLCAGEALGGADRPEDLAIYKAPGVDSEGCRLAGTLEVTRTEGNFHFAPGHRLHRRANAMTFLDRVQVALESFNTTHTINNLHFGDLPPAGHASPKHVVASMLLNGHHKTVQDTHAMHQYFLQLVPTVYRLGNGLTVHSNQYSATEHLRHVHSGPSRGLPGVYFYYQISPVQALVEEKRRGFLAFLTGACGVIGGVYNILSLMNTGIGGFLRRRGGRGTRHRSM